MAADWRFLQNVLSAGQAKLASEGALRERWQVLAFDAVPQTLLSQAPESANLSAFKRDKWRTIWSDGEQVKSFDETVLCLSDHLHTLQTEVFSRAKAHRCLEGNLCCRYKMELLKAQPVAGGKSSTLWRPSEPRFFDFCSCKLLSDSEEKQRRVDAEETSRLAVHSIVGKTISIDCLTDEYDIGADQPQGGRVWQTMRLTDHGLKPYRLPKSCLKKADALYDQLSMSDETAGDYGPNYFETKGFLLKPAKEGLAIEFQCDSRIDPCDPTVYRLALEQAAGLDEVQRANYRRFTAEHPDLTDLSQADAVTVAPDQRSVVYSSNRQLFWHNIDGRIVNLGSINDLRGWQWIDTVKMNQAELSWLGSTVHAAAS
jgi:hypothetical protein